MANKILIILEQKQLHFYNNGQLDRSFSVAVGKQNTPTPTGNFSIINKIKNPYNPTLGTRWLQFTSRMHGIHGTNQPHLIGQAVSKGCVRMYNRDVEYIFPQVSIGTTVQIKTTTAQENVEYFIYTVQVNDSLYHLARKFETTIANIIKINNLENKNLIYPGQQLKIPL
ncbi:L,D-transpeptidase family protein [Halanaerobacter jeridensis]|uniref:LysM domain-containing protein n=1 Tax=Halanaerobacter jeridensis TaxID=706427 RepID=A0A938XVU4_9FIRM|nr:L,D-transpeptidase family protein [Halanaerobacter jeridensis]MBM7557216.1 hypothetical protein [Halanaerobacter jeridensis]